MKNQGNFNTNINTTMPNTATVRILLIGPKNSGKSRIANFLCEQSSNLPQEDRPTKALRILEFDIKSDKNSDIDVQLWDSSGDDIYSEFWPVFRKHSDGVVFVYSQDDDLGIRKLDQMYNYFVTQRNLPLKACLVCAVQTDETNTKLSSTFSKISQINVNLDTQGDKFKKDFSKFISSVTDTLAE